MRSTDPRRDLRRHDRVWLDAATWRSSLRSPIDDARLRLLDDWVGRGRAFVVRRREPDASPDTCFAAVALPLAAGRVRIAAAFDERCIARHAPPLRLDEIVDAAPGPRDALDDLVERTVAIDTTLQVYGSYAWQAIAGEPCVTASSDLDLLCDVRDARHAGAVIDVLREWERTHGLRADGELRFADGAAIAWRELGSASARVLVKRDDGVALEPSPLRAVVETA